MAKKKKNSQSHKMFPVIFHTHTHFTLAKVQLLSKNEDVSPGKRRDLSDDSGFFNMLFS